MQTIMDALGPREQIEHDANSDAEEMRGMFFIQFK
jgi:hypothetical protein